MVKRSAEAITTPELANESIGKNDPAGQALQKFPSDPSQVGVPRKSTIAIKCQKASRSNAAANQIEKRQKMHPEWFLNYIVWDI
jgi:hypothetical protein